MSNPRKKNLIYSVIFTALLLSFSALIPSLRISVFNSFKYPLTLLTFVNREIGGIIFYHRNLAAAERLTKKNGLLKYNLNSAKEIYLENNRLRELLSLKQKSAFKVISARVIGRALDNWSSAIIIDKGESSGIKKGFVVIDYSGLVGRVVEAAKFTSKIMLINDPNFGVSGVIQRSRQEGLITGTLGNSLAMKYLTGDSDVKISDVVITSGLTENYPKGQLIGVVTGVGYELSGLSRYAVIKPAVNLSNLEEVLVIVK